MGEPDPPAHVLDALKQWQGMRWSGSLEIRYRRGEATKIYERREYSEHDSATE
jgi:hypothetical protein